MTSSLDEHLASYTYSCTAAGSRALVGQLRDDHGKTLYSSPHENHAAHSAMHAAAHETDRSEPPPARHTAQGLVLAGAEPAGDGTHEHD